MKVILISGKARHGKDTAAGILQLALAEEGQSALIAHYADLVKYICEKFFGWNGVKDEEGRTLLQKVGTDLVRTQQPNYWVDFLISIFKLFPDQWDYVIIPDCRFPNEIDAIKNAGFETIHVRIVRNNFDNGLTEEQKNHPSETSLDDYKADYYLNNDAGMMDLLYAVNNFVQELKGYHQITFDELEAQCEN